MLDVNLELSEEGLWEVKSYTKSSEDSNMTWLFSVKYNARVIIVWSGLRQNSICQKFHILFFFLI